jgi:hypothetical protein
MKATASYIFYTSFPKFFIGNLFLINVDFCQEIAGMRGLNIASAFNMAEAHG